MNRLEGGNRAQILGMMVEGMSMRAITRMTGVSKNTVAKLLEDAGTAFSEFQDATLRKLPCQRIKCDEIWSFVAAKARNVEGMKRQVENAGDVWTWTAIDADTKLVPCFMVGDRSAATAYFFMKDLASRLRNRVQLTTDGHRAYLSAVEGNFGRGGIDYAMLIKQYGPDPEGERRYSPAQCLGVEKDEVFGNPDPKHISTSYVERQNLSMRMGIRRFTRLTNAFSKKFENHVHALAIYFMHYNFVRIHQTLRVTPAMEAGVVSSPWTLTDMMTVLEAWEAKQPRKKVGRKPKNRAEN